MKFALAKSFSGDPERLFGLVSVYKSWMSVQGQSPGRCIVQAKQRDLEASQSRDPRRRKRPLAAGKSP